MKNILLKTTTIFAIACLIISSCAMDMTPVVAVMLFGSLAWLLPFTIANKGRW